MSINNLSNDRGGIGHLQGRLSFQRDNDGSMRSANGHQYDQSNAGSEASGNSEGRLFDGGSGRPDHRSIARAMMARLDAFRERYFGGGGWGGCGGGGTGTATTDSTTPPVVTPTDSSTVVDEVVDTTAITEAEINSDVLVDSNTSVDAEEATNNSSANNSWQPSHGNDGRPSHWHHHGYWYTTGNAPSGSNHHSHNANPPSTTNNTSSPSSPSSPSGTGGASNTPSTQTPPPPSTPPLTVPPAPPIGPQSASSTISLHDGTATIANKYITGEYGIMAENDTHVSTLNVSNVTIRSTNYGIYLGSADTVNLSNVNIQCDPNGGDSYSVRGAVKHLYSSDSVYQSGIKAFRIYGLESGSSTRDTFTGDRLMLGGGYDNEWDDGSGLGSFHNFTFTDARISVNSIELYDDTSNVTFENVDFSGTDHISIQPGAHDIIFKNCTNIPEIRLYDGNDWTSPPAGDRNIVILD